MRQIRFGAGPVPLVLTLQAIFAVMLGFAAISALAAGLSFEGVGAALKTVAGPASSGVIDRLASHDPLIEASNAVSFVCGAIIVMLLLRILAAPDHVRVVSTRTARIIFAVASLLLVSDLIGSGARFVVSGHPLTYFKVLVYVGIFCIYILSYVLYRAAKMKDWEGLV